MYFFKKKDDLMAAAATPRTPNKTGKLFDPKSVEYFHTTAQSIAVAGFIAEWLYENINDDFIKIAFNKEIAEFLHKNRIPTSEESSIEDIRGLLKSINKTQELSNFNKYVENLKKSLSLHPHNTLDEDKLEIVIKHAYKDDIDKFLDENNITLTSEKSSIEDIRSSLEENIRSSIEERSIQKHKKWLEQFNQHIENLKKKIGGNISVYSKDSDKGKKKICISISGSYDSPKYNFLYDKLSGEDFKTYLREKLKHLEVSLGLQNTDLTCDINPEYPVDSEITVQKRTREVDLLIEDSNRQRNEDLMGALKAIAFKMASEEATELSLEQFKKTPFYQEFSKKNPKLLVENLEETIECEASIDYRLLKDPEIKEDLDKELMKGLKSIQGNKAHKKRCSEGLMVFHTALNPASSKYGEEDYNGVNIKLPVSESPAYFIFNEFDKIDFKDQKKIHDLLSNTGMGYKQQFEKIKKQPKKEQKSLKSRKKELKKNTLSALIGGLGEIEITSEVRGALIKDLRQDDRFNEFRQYFPRYVLDKFNICIFKCQGGSPGKWIEAYITPPCETCLNKAFAQQAASQESRRANTRTKKCLMEKILQDVVLQ